MASSSSDIKGRGKLLGGTYELLGRVYEDLGNRFEDYDAATAREFRELHREMTRLRDENARLQDEYTRAQDTIAALQDELTRSLESGDARRREEVIPLERDRKRKREGPSIEGGNFAVPYADTTSRIARDRSAPLPGFLPHETRISDDGTNAADDFELLRSSSDSSRSPDRDANDSWSPSWATNESDTDEILFQPSPSSDTGSLTPHFPFKVFLGTFLDDNDTNTAETIEFDNLSVEFRQAVVEHTKGWVEEGLERWKSWDRVVVPHNECVYHKAFGIGTCHWTSIYPRFYTCMTCANQRRLCFKKHGDEVWLLPLPPEVDEDADLGTLGSFVIQHEEGKASTKETRYVWEKVRGEASYKKANREV
ncbi:hypothetical protein NU219Hw_g289t1 [Hortaea werneckii]